MLVYIIIKNIVPFPFLIILPKTVITCLILYETSKIEDICMFINKHKMYKIYNILTLNMSV